MLTVYGLCAELDIFEFPQHLAVTAVTMTFVTVLSIIRLLDSIENRNVNK